MDGAICTDASAALGVAHRQGLEKIRHIDVQHLWIQEKVYNKPYLKLLRAPLPAFHRKVEENIPTRNFYKLIHLIFCLSVVALLLASTV